MVLNKVEFRYPKPKLIKVSNTATGKIYFNNNSKNNIDNVALEIKNNDNTTNVTKYSLDRVSFVEGSYLSQNPKNTYLVIQNKKINTDSNVFLCFKVVSGSDGINVFNENKDKFEVNIDTSMKTAPTNTIIKNDANTVIILDCPVSINKPVLASKHFNIIEDTLKQQPLLTTTKITSVTHVLTTASCQTVNNTVSNNLNPKSKLAIHATMFIITFLIIVGGWIGKSIVANNDTVSWALGSIWFLLAVIVGSIAATNKYNKKEDFAKTVLVTRYLLFDLSALMFIFNWDVIKEWWKLSLNDKITKPFKNSYNIVNTIIKLIGILVGVGMIIYLFVI